jgi:hypothetical protein
MYQPIALFEMVDSSRWAPPARRTARRRPSGRPVLAKNLILAGQPAVFDKDAAVPSAVLLNPEGKVLYKAAAGSDPLELQEVHC